MSPIAIPPFRISIAGSYRHVLGFEWDVRYYVDEAAEPYQLVSDAVRKRHDISVSPGILRAPEFFEPDIAQVHCKAKLAEAIDPAFATLRFKREYDIESPEFRRRANLLYQAWAHVDIWADDLRHEHWPELSARDHLSFAESIAALAAQGQHQMLRSFQGIHGIAILLAEEERYHLPMVNLVPAMEALGAGLMRTVVDIGVHYKTVPRLSYDPDQDVALLERSVIRVSQLLELDIRPHLIEQDECWVWDVGEIID